MNRNIFLKYFYSYCNMVSTISVNDIKNIVMKCLDDQIQIKYDNPKKMIDKYGNSLYAYVVSVFNDIDIAGAIVVAQSIRELGSLVDLVVFVTPNIGDIGKFLLGSYFTHIYVNDLVDKESDINFSRLVALNLDNYDKIIMVEPNCIFLRYVDHLFTLSAPAGCIIEDRESIITYDEHGNFTLPNDSQLNWYKKFCECCGHGKIIPKEKTDDLKNVIMTGLLVFKPNKEEFKNIMSELSNSKERLTFQEYITKRYSGVWTSIDPKFYGLMGYPHWKVLFGVHFEDDKPYVMDSKIPIRMRSQYPDFALWHQFYSDILDRNPVLRRNKILFQANEMHLYFQSSVAFQKRTIVKFGDIKQKTFYYHTNKDTIYLPKLSPMWENIKAYNYFEPIKRLAKYHGQKSYYTKLIQNYDSLFKHKTMKRLDEFEDMNLNVVDRDLIMLEYIKTRPSIFIITIYPKLSKKVSIDEIVNGINMYGNVYYVKTIPMSKNLLSNLLFWMYDQLTFGYKNEFIAEKFGKIDGKNNNQISFIVFDNVNKESINEIQHKIKNKINELLNMKNEYDISDFYHINDYYSQSVDYAEMILNENTLKFLEFQNIENIINQAMTDSHLLLQTFKKWCFSNLSLLEIGRVIMIGGIVLYSYGIRKTDNINGIFASIGNSDSQTEKEFETLVYDSFIHETTKFTSMDLNVEGSKYWDETYAKKKKEILKFLELSGFVEIVTDPKYHYYFQGLKYLLIDHEIIRKIYRNDVSDHADFLMIGNLYPKLISEYVEISSGAQIKYLIKTDPPIIPPNVTSEYLMSILKVIYNKYLRSDIEKFKFKMEK